MKHTTRCAAVAFCAAFAHASPSLATHTGSVALGGGNLSSPINTESAVPLPQGHFIVGLRSEFIDIARMSPERALQLHEENEEADLHSASSLLTNSLGVAFGATENLTLGLRLSHVLRDDVTEPEDGEIERLGDSSGVGDAVAFGQYHFFHNAGSDAHASLLFGVKAPTGRTHEIAVEDERFETEQQPGSGSWDGLLGLAYTRPLGTAASFHASAIYSLIGEGAQDTDLGDTFSYNTALTYRLGAGSARRETQDWFFLPKGNRALDLILELNGQWRERQTIDGRTERNSGSHQIYLSPGLRLTAGRHWNAGLSLGIPLLDHFNGDQDELDYRLVGTVSFYY